MNLRTTIGLLAVLMLAASASFAAEKPKPAAAPEKQAPAEKSAPKPAGGLLGGMTMGGPPQWTPPDQYSVDLVMTNEGKSFTMKRFISGGKTRSEMSAEGREMIMLERPEDGGAIYNIMPSEKMAMKMTPGGFAEDAPKEDAKVEKAADVKIESLGKEQLDGRAALKYRMTADKHTALGWFEESTGAPIRMEAEGAVIEWKNFKPGPIPAKMFEVPKDYQVTDMDEMMKQMKSMRGAGLGAGAAMSGAVPGAMSAMRPGMGGMGGGLSGMAGNYGSQMGSNMGQQFGSGVGAAFGGPLGAMAGGYIGGKVGGWLGRKTADAVTPGPPSR
jgi:hypothetical protein